MLWFFYYRTSEVYLKLLHCAITQFKKLNNSWVGVSNNYVANPTHLNKNMNNTDGI